MAKNLTLFLFLQFWCQLSSAQQNTYKFGEIYSINEFSPYEIIGETETDFVVSGKGKGLVSYGVNGIVDLKIAIIDKNTLSITKILSFPKFQVDDMPKKGMTFIQGKVLRGDTLHIITSTWDKIKKDYAIHVWALNVESLDPLTPTAKLITRVPDNGKYFSNILRLIQFERTEDIAIIYAETNKNTKSRVLNIIHLDHQFTLINKHVIANYKNHTWIGMKHIEADSEGNIFILSGFSEVSSSDMSGSQLLGLQMIPAVGGEIVTTTIKTQTGTAFNGNICLNSSGEMFVCGYYSAMTESKDREKEFFGGTFIAKVFPKDGKVVTMDEKELTENQKKALRLPHGSANNLALAYTRINQLKILKLFIDNEDNITMVGMSEVTIEFTSGNSTLTEHESNSIFTSRFSASGNVIWHTITPKSSIISDYKGILDPVVLFDNGTTTLLFNDHTKNIAVMNSLASGENTDSYTSYSSAETAIPLDLPPSDSDETSDYSIWKQENTILRKTIIDSTGKWKVSWINLESSKENEKNALLNGAFNYNDLEGNIISYTYPKYGAFTKVQNAAIIKIVNSNNHKSD